MKMPERMPARPRLSDQPAYARGSLIGALGALQPQFLPDLNQLKCAACCAGKSGFGACLARCLLTGDCCDGGLDNCTRA